MSARIPKLSETCEIHWRSLFECIQETTDPKEQIHVFLKTEPIEDGIEESLVLDDKNKVVESPHYPIDVFRLYVKSGDTDDVGNNYLGSAKRIFEQDTAEFNYAQSSIEQLRHQVGLRLERLGALKREIYFTSDILGYNEHSVTDELLADLFSSDSKELSVVMEKILDSD